MKREIKKVRPSSSYPRGEAVILSMSKDQFHQLCQIAIRGAMEFASGIRLQGPGILNNLNAAVWDEWRNNLEFIKISETPIVEVEFEL